MKATQIPSIRLGLPALRITITLLTLTTGARCNAESELPTGEEQPGRGAISVTVVNSAGSPSGAAVTVRLTGPASFPERTGITTFGAPFTLTELPPGTYTLAVGGSVKQDPLPRAGF